MPLPSRVVTVPLNARALPSFAPSMAMFINRKKIEEEDRKEDYKWVMYPVLRTHARVLPTK
jgi:hypothetical protein